MNRQTRILLRIALALLCGLPLQVFAAAPRIYGWVEDGVLEPEHVNVKLKLDTGALTSSMDAQALKRFTKDGERWVRFNVEVKDTKSGEWLVLPFERRVERNIKVRGAGGADHRPVVRMQVCIGKQLLDEEFSLNNRSKMLYPILIGRRTLEHLGAVDVSQTFTSQPDCSAS
ncbi:retropepsin-like aspartic peptidase RloA3 [Pseudomonas sp. N040]|uniref:retropepsin-like aspartic peptidase RloA3 n=1 Tax=Pseudomonas sp. N040 TaxID=2785325 RepID=UPI0018A2C195|nr:ATP-dependent zinc protease [Pseudomonas sp. N040]MBF7730215.1 ATP-dependent zinc protease [Pseudomonas sp. N040]MBW7013857.1 ATP-dependent zinc protease [Pseudomonas sp. N040]